MKTVAITGAGGFIGAYLTRKMVALGYNVRAIDNFLRGRPQRLENIEGNIEVFNVDVRKEEDLVQVFNGCDAVFHLAAINGTENFYKRPQLVLDVGVCGMIAVANACIKAKVSDIVVASSAEVYQSPSIIPTNEEIPMIIPDSLNPRYSYGASKLISEIITFNYCRDILNKVQVFRPHNVYGPDMGYKHVIPQFIEKINQARETGFITIQGNGSETRAFAYVEDIVNGIITMWLKGDTMNVYHIGATDEISVYDLAKQISEIMGVDIEIKSSALQEGGTTRRCPDVSKMGKIGYEAKVSLKEGLKNTIEWYLENLDKKPLNDIL